MGKEGVRPRNEILVARSGYVDLPCFDDAPDGHLVIGEGNRNIPFEIKRVYYINQLGNPTAIRGKHAHRELEQVIFAVNGSFVLHLDDGTSTQEILMNKPEEGVFLGKMLWHEMTGFSADCCLLVVASEYYSEVDYIRKYDQFVKCLRGE